MAEDGTSEKTNAPAAESQTDPSEVPTVPAEHETAAPSDRNSVDQPTGSASVASADGAQSTAPKQSTGPAGETGITEDTTPPQDSSAAAAEAEAPTAPADTADQPTASASVASTDDAQPTPPERSASPAAQSAVPEDARPPQDSSPSIEVHGELDGEPGLTEPQPEARSASEPAPRPSGTPVVTEREKEPEPPSKPPPEPTVAPSPAPVVIGRDAPQSAGVSGAQPVGAPRRGMGRFERGVVVTVLLGIAVAALVALALPRKALLVVSAMGPSDQSLQSLKIMVDGDLRCEKSPCPVGDLSAGEHTIRVSSDDFGVAERVLAMRTGADHSLAFVFERPRRDAATSLTAASAPAEPSAEASQGDQGHGVTAAARSTRARGPGTGTIKANSIPVSDVLVDGRLHGKTPANISTAPGLHTVVFIHPDYGRREVVVQVKPNQDAVAAVRFRRSTP